MELTNERKVILKGRANINSELELGKCYSITASELECREVKSVPNDDGSQDTIYSLVISELSDLKIISENGIIPAKRKGSQSRVLRWKIMQLAEMDGKELPEEKEFYYKEKMNEIIKRIDDELNII